jgi:DNA-binding transcriptional MocR family regulator
MSTPTPALALRLARVHSSPVREILALTQRPGVISFAGGLPAPELFAAETIAAGFAAALSKDSASRALQYSSTEGDPQLRALLAERFNARELPTTAEDVLVTTGSQQALGLITNVLADPQDTILVENPSYLAALQSFDLAGARIIAIPCDEEGLDPEALSALIVEHHPKFLYTMPTFQNPTGRTLSAERRARIAELAGEYGLWVVEDDPYSELRYEGEELLPIAAYPGATDRTITVSSLSKVLAPGLRLGWLRAPTRLLRPLTVAKQAADLHTSTVDQMAAAHVLAHSDLDEHVIRARDEYRRRRNAMLNGLLEALPEDSTFNRPHGGMFIWARLPEGWDAAELLERALVQDVAFVPGMPFFAHDGDPRSMRLAFTTHSATEITEGLRRLRSAHEN